MPSMIVSFVIPVRLASSRLPRKSLADIHGRSLLWYVWNRVSQARNGNEVIVATDSEEVLEAVRAWGGRVLLTGAHCRSGTERIATILPHLAGDLIINVQGDEVLIEPLMLDKLVAHWKANPVDLITPVFRITKSDELMDPNLVKVVRASNGRAIYFSRSVIPYVRDLPAERWLEGYSFWGHVGVYGFRREVLKAYPALQVSPLELAERLEQLRFLSAGYQIHTIETHYQPISVNTSGDLERVRVILKEDG
jgi:3-deoxy-manno-octulosonate cytidylyltransferase (CMP-KDO synthetase)